MSRWSPVYVPEIETGRHIKNNVCTVEIKINWMMRRHTSSAVVVERLMLELFEIRDERSIFEVVGSI
jgi:hypothetical protein